MLAPAMLVTCSYRRTDCESCRHQDYRSLGCCGALAEPLVIVDSICSFQRLPIEKVFSESFCCSSRYCPSRFAFEQGPSCESIFLAVLRGFCFEAVWSSE